MAAEAGKGDSVRPTNHAEYSANYDLIFRKKSMLTVKKFGASWCGPCSSLSMTLATIMPKYPNVLLEEIDIDKNQLIAKDFNIRSVPTLIKLKDGIEVNRLTGAQTAEKLETWLTN